MRLNKMRLAAAMMSAVMAASTMSTAAFAEDLIVDEDVVSVVSEGVAVDEIVEDQVELTADPLEVDSVDISETGVVTVYYSNGDVDKTTYKATSVEVAATCTEPKTIKWTTTEKIEGKYYTQSYTVGTALGHDFDHTKRLAGILDQASCDEAGTGYYYYKCTRCDAEEFDKTFVIEPADHVKGTPEVTYIEDKDAAEPNVTIKNGVVSLIDPSKDGYYVEVTTTKCTVCKKVIETETKKVKKVKPATDVEVAKRVVKSDAKGNINTDLTAIDGKEPAKVVDDELAMVDCTKDGYYWIVSYDKNNNEISRSKHVVKAHHLEYLEFAAKNKDDAPLLKDVLDEDGNVIDVKNTSCYKNVECYKIVKCAAEPVQDGSDKVLSKSLITVAPEGEHPLAQFTVNKVQAAVDEAKNNGVVSVDTYKNLKKNETNWSLKVTAKDACEADGTVEITMLCPVCKAEVKTVTLKLAKLGHEWGQSVEENVVEATCSKAGSYDVVRYCDVCGKKEVLRAGVVIPKLNHTFDTKTGVGYGVEFKGDVVVDARENGYGVKGAKYALNAKIGVLGYNVLADTFKTCTVCGEKVFDANNASNAVTVVDVKKGTNGNAGTITLNATYEATVDGKVKTLTTGDVTFPYYTNLIEYLDRNPGSALNGLHLDNDGVYRYYKDGEFQSKFTGIVEFEGGEFFVGNGVLCSGANGLNLYNGTWYMLSAGQIQRGYTGLALYDGEWFYLTNGVLDTSVSRLVEYDGEKFAVAAGRLLQEVNGLWQNPADGEWYFVALGRAVSEFTGTTTYDGKTFELVNGKLV